MGLHFPVYLWIGPWSIHPHILFESLAYLVGARIYALVKRTSTDPIDPTARWWIVVAAFVGATVGSKLVVLADHPILTLSHLTDPLALLEGKTVVGALVGALLAVEGTKLRLGIHQATGDVFVLPLVFGIALGRVGCFLTGLSDNTYGLPTALPWAVDFGDGIPRHPAQLYEIAFLLVGLLPVVLWLNRRPHRQGDLFKVFMIGYLTFRLGLEFIKPGDPLLGLTAIQWVCVATLMWYSRFIPRLWRATPVELAHG
jgi:phosphatidylglycerol:prolipoprotein diacylglycerol transferase